MSHSKEQIQSDDEFHDALGEAQSQQAVNERDIEELIRKKQELNIEDDDEYEIAKGDDDDDDAAATTTADGIAAGGEGGKTVTELDGTLSSEELQELEKNLSPEQLEENIEKSHSLKLTGNEQFKSEQIELAIETYTEALNLCPTTNPKDRAVLFSNRAAAKIKLDAKKSAIDDCTNAIQLWPDYVRALLRRAKLYEQDDKLDEAFEDYKRVYELDPGQPEAREAQVRLPPLINERNEKLKEEMLTSLKSLGNMILKPFGLSTSNFEMQKDPNSGSYSINFNQNNR